MLLNFKKLSEYATIPTRGSEGAAGYDLYTTGDGEILPGCVGVFPTDIAMEIPKDYYGRIAPRSSVSKHCVDVFAGVVDSDYRGNIKVMLCNTSKDSIFKVSKGDRIAQIIFQPCIGVCFLEANELEASVRGSDGFGSTGK